MPQLTNTIFTYRPDLSMARALTPKKGDIEGAKVSPVFVSANELRLRVELLDSDDKPVVVMVAWQIEPGSVDNMTTDSLILSVSCLNKAELSYGFDVLNMLTNRIQ